MMNDPLTEATNTVLRSIHDLADFPLYVYPQRADRMPAGATAYVTPCNPLWRSRLEASGQWQGVGRLVVVNDVLLSQPLDLVGCLVHEVSHLLPPTTPVLIGETTPGAFAFCTALESRDAGTPADNWVGASAFHHDAAFCRRLLHVRHRVQRGLGTVLPFDTLGVYHGPCHVSIMARVLAGEPQRMETATFAEIDATPAPAAFTWLWEHYTARKER